MIFTDIQQAKEQIRWLAHNSSSNHFAAERLSSYEFDIMEKKITSKDDADILAFFDLFFESLKIKKPQWSETLEHEALPVLALVPNGGLHVIIELEADGSWKSETPIDVQKTWEFPLGTLFTSVKIERSENKKTSATEMFKEIALRQKPFVIYAAIASLSINILALGTSFFSMQVYDRVIPTQGTSTLIALSIGVFIAIFLEMILKLSRSSILDHAAKNMDIAYSHDIFSRFLKIRSDALPKSIGTLSGQLQSYGTVRSFISSAALYLVVDFPFSLLFLAVIVLIAGWQMGLIALVFLAISIITGMIFKKKIEILSQTSTMASHKKLGLLVETVENAENVKATGAGWSILSRWNALSEDGIYDDIEIRHYSELSNYMTAFFQQLSYVALVATGAYLVSETNTMTMGGLIATTILSGRVLSPIAMLPNLLVQWGRTKIAVKDLDNVYRLQSDNEGISRPLSPKIIEPRYLCQNIKFSYTKEGNLLQIAKLVVNAGERIAILGSIGSGKSTLLKILAGLYMPQEGNILINGIDMHHISRNRLNETINYLPQSVKLFSGTLRDNLLLGLVGVDDEKIMSAAQVTGLIHLINALPQGLDTLVPEGGESVSGGQKQLISITRLILTSAKVWLLDEPTASMDEVSERHMLGILNHQITSDKTLILVTHKPALLGLVNRIIVMTPNGIAMDGPRDAVLQELANRSKAQTQGK
ncbi:MAG: ATP-binding cassette domain-containing protein [Sulfuricurvum sp.]|nr:ATP-binding cassette domain-containing protein [Sulfuricurvum sp.]